MKNLILIGGGGHCLSCIDVIELQNYYRIAGLVDNKLRKKKFKYKILGKDEDLKQIFKKYKSALVTIGFIKDFEKREKTFLNLKKIGFKMPSIISPLAYVSPKAKIGEGTIVMHGAIINRGAIIGNNCIVNTKALIEHDTSVGDNCHVSTRSTLNGGVIIGNNSFIGSHAILKQNIKVGKNCFVNANLFVNKNIKDNSKIYE